MYEVFENLRAVALRISRTIDVHAITIGKTRLFEWNDMLQDRQ